MLFLCLFVGESIFKQGVNISQQNLLITQKAFHCEEVCLETNKNRFTDVYIERNISNCFILVEKNVNSVYDGIWNVSSVQMYCCGVQSCSQELLKYLKYWDWIPAAQTHPLKNLFYGLF